MIKRESQFTFQQNLKHGRHGWLRLTPAYSVQLVRQLLVESSTPSRVLDPFSGTGTTGLTCAEYGIECDLIDINPFLVWLAKVKTANYSAAEVENTLLLASQIYKKLTKQELLTPEVWLPPISNRERWWNERTLLVLAHLKREILASTKPSSNERNLLLLSFCRSVIDQSNAAFNHQSTSFKQAPSLPLEFDRTDEVMQQFVMLVQQMAIAASQPMIGQVQVHQGNSRNLDAVLRHVEYDLVITSPPYPNRMSYVRELRPYMYWLDYLNAPQDASDLDWNAIGGTWGTATSRLNSWQTDTDLAYLPDLGQVLNQITIHSPLLSNYVKKYFVDMHHHIRTLYPLLKSNASIYYIVGNSKFYDTVVPVELLFAAMFNQHGFEQIDIQVLRKRNSKKELLEFVVSAKKR